jgi:hypothetical protein
VDRLSPPPPPAELWCGVVALCTWTSDLNFMTIHGKSRFPGLFIWTREGKRVPVKVPDGCLLVQAGKQFEYMTAGHVLAGHHEVRVTLGSSGWPCGGWGGGGALAGCFCSCLFFPGLGPHSRIGAPRAPGGWLLVHRASRKHSHNTHTAHTPSTPPQCPVRIPLPGGQVIVAPETVAAIARASEAGRSLWRVSSTLFYHVNSDQSIAPVGAFASAPGAEAFPALEAGEQVRLELEHIKLGGPAARLAETAGAGTASA